MRSTTSTASVVTAWLACGGLLLPNAIVPAAAFVPAQHVRLSTSSSGTSKIGRFSTVNPVEEDKKSDEADKVASMFEGATDESPAKMLGGGIPYEQLTIGVVKETFPGENRVSQTPDSIRSLVKAGFHVVVETGGTSIDGCVHVCVSMCLCKSLCRSFVALCCSMDRSIERERALISE